MKIYFANDCRAYHGGSWAVSEVIRSEIAAAGHSLLVESDPARIEMDAISEADAIIVNGEGTLHHNKSRPRHLLDILAEGQRRGKWTALINTSWQDMSNDHDDVLRRLDHFTVRETLSLRELDQKHGVTATLFPDLSLQYPITIPDLPKDDRTLITDLYAAEFGCFVILNGGSRSKLPLLDMRKLNWSDTLATVKRHPVFVTGRFHGMMAALRARTPIVAFGGNTHKIAGVMHWAGQPQLCCDTPSALFTAAGKVKRLGELYEKLFDWAAQLPKWRLPAL